MQKCQKRVSCTFRKVPEELRKVQVEIKKCRKYCCKIPIFLTCVGSFLVFFLHMSKLCWKFLTVLCRGTCKVYALQRGTAECSVGSPQKSTGVSCSRSIPWRLAGVTHSTGPLRDLSRNHCRSHTTRQPHSSGFLSIRLVYVFLCVCDG